MAASQDFYITDTKKGDIFRDNNPEGNNSWIVTRRNFDTVFLCPYDTNNNIITGPFIIVSLDDLNNDYTYVRRGSASGRKSRKGRKGRKSRKSRKSRRGRKSRKH